MFIYIYVAIKIDWLKFYFPVDKNTRYCSLEIVCHTRSGHCIYSDNGFTFRTKNVRVWLHLMFLSIQAQSETAVSQRDPRVSCLKEVWDALRTDSSSNNFVRLVTSKFPSAKVAYYRVCFHSRFIRPLSIMTASSLITFISTARFVWRVVLIAWFSLEKLRLNPM